MTKVIYVGLDVHAETIAVATADEGRDGEVRFHGMIANTAEALKALSARLSRQGVTPDFCYEAGPCGYGVHRCLTALGLRCTVVAPCLIPRKAGDRVKTDRRDAQMLARLHRAGELQAVWTPDEAHEAMRDLIRARKQAVEALKVARHGRLTETEPLRGLALIHHQMGHYRRRCALSVLVEVGHV